MLAGLIAIWPLSAAAQDQQLCRNIAAESAGQSIAKIAEKLEIAIPSVTSGPVLDDVAAQVCDSVDQTKADKIKQIASTVSSAYFENAIKLGKSTEVAALVQGAIDHTLGLGLDDLRRYGTLMVSCAYAAASVEVRGFPAQCGKRTLLEKGDLQISVTGGGVALCKAATTLGERQELVCDCIALGATPGIPLTMACK
jgi:hypothetical protein